MNIQWNLLQGADIPGAFNQGLQTAQRNALLQRETALREQEVDQRGRIFEQQQQDRQRQQQQEVTADQQRLIVTGARIIEQVRPQDQAGWQQVIATARQLGLDVSQVPQQFDPAYAQQVVQAAQAIAEHTGQNPTTMQRNYEWLQQVNPDLAQQYIRNEAEGSPIVASNGDGTFTIVPRSQIGGTAPAQQQGEMTATNPQTGERLRLNPQTNQWEPVQGGASPSNGSQTFPGQP
jgi:hypothetical protein